MADGYVQVICESCVRAGAKIGLENFNLNFISSFVALFWYQTRPLLVEIESAEISRLQQIVASESSAMASGLKAG